MAKEGAEETQAVWEDLVVSILSVNQYSIEKSYSLIEQLREQGLVAPHNLISWEQSEIARRLYRAGYNRGEFMTNAFANRLASLGDYIKDKGIDHCQQILLSSNRALIERTLRPVKGVGNVVLNNFYILRGIK